MINDIFKSVNEKLQKKGYRNLSNIMKSIDEYYEHTHPGMCRGWELPKEEEIFDFSILAKEVG